jgi:hypothetical protein
MSRRSNGEVAAVVRSLPCNGLLFRGHTENSASRPSGNVIMALKLIAEFASILAVAKNENPGRGHTSYLSLFIYEQFNELMANKVTKQITEEVKCVKYYSIIVDSTPDILHVDKLAVIPGYVKEAGFPVERFLLLFPSTGHKSVQLFQAVFSTLEMYHLNNANCRGQMYENTPNMAAPYSAFQDGIKEESPLVAVYVPFSAHSLNFIGQCTASCCKEAIAFSVLL